MKRFLFITALCALPLPALAASPVEQGRYQAVLGDCQGCHGKNLAGGVVLATPFGNLVTPNITPDKDTGIGNYSADDFRNAMKTGVAKGKLLYPAMPYPAYARMSDADVAALWAYLKSVKPVKHQAGESHLRFPYNLRFLMRGWNLLFFDPKPYAHYRGPASADYDRGEYIVLGAAHCSTCHSPKNMLGADKSSALSGASLSGWFAPNLTSDRATGLGGWSQDDIVEYLKTGRNSHSIASGPMREAIENSTALMNDGDLKAIAVYLKDLPATGGAAQTGSDARMASGAGVYRVTCAGCHGLDGKGEKALFPPLAGNSLVTQASAETLIRLVLEGSQGAATPKAPTGPAMPGFAWKLSDSQAADVLTYIRGQWGNRAQAVDSDAVAAARTSLQASP